MRKHQQKQILKLIQTINPVQSAGLYADCQEAAVSIGSFIESIEGEGTQTVALLEEYCELLFKASKGEIKEKVLRKQLIKIENSVMLELKPNRIEMVFLVYKASMGDSLESIYLEAKADPCCDAYWVPIPYYELNADGSLGIMHYEGADYYSENIVCTDCREYDIEARHPDVIFTHYAYDNNVNNASIHPAFYSERLHECCEILMYVPYFVSSSGVVPEYCGYLPGVLYAHHVIVESESVRQSYIKHYTKFDKELGWKGQFGKSNEKFLAFGSPKFDKIINTKREDCELPYEWRRLIENPAGSRKKVILYNTHMFTWINNGEAYFKKLRFVFEFFRNRDDVVLWWRPHPATELNFRIKRPEWLDEYKAVVDGYKSGGWGIYDDTPDLHRAITWSDVYYGDRSSLVALYQATGKPIVIQNIKVNGQYDFCDTAIFVPVAFYGDDIWANVDNFNALIKIDKKTLEPEYIGEFPCASNKSRKLYRQATMHDKIIYFAPFLSGGVAEYDISQKTFTTLSFNHEKSKENNTRAFRDAINHGKYIFFTPFRYNAIMRLNTVTGDFDFFDDWVAPLNQMITAKNDACLSMPLRTYKNTIMLAALGANAVIEFNMDTLKSTVHKVGKTGYQYNGICFDGENYWLSPRHDGPVVKWNPEIGIIKEFADLAEGSPKNRNCFCAILFCEGCVWLLPKMSKRAVKIDVKTDTVSTVEEFTPSFVDGEPRVYAGAYYFARNKDSLIYAYDGKDGTLIEYNCKTQVKREKIIKYPKAVKERMRPASYRRFDKNIDKCVSLLDCCYREKHLRTMPELIDYIINNYDSSQMTDIRNKQLEIFAGMNSNPNGTAGKEIFAYCKKFLGVM